MSKKNAARRQEAQHGRSTGKPDTSEDSKTNTDMQTQAAGETSGESSAETTTRVDRRRNPDGTERYAKPYKYETVGVKAREAKLEYKADWPKRDVMITVHPTVHPKGNGNSVMSRIVALVGSMKDENGKPKPILGRELAVQVRHYDFPNANRSKYLEGGIPEIGWAEGYIDGAIQKKFLTMVNPEAVHKRGAAETKSDAAEKAGEAEAMKETAGEGEATTVTEAEVGSVVITGQDLHIEQTTDDPTK